MCAGAGLTTTVFDLINDAGGHPATYVEFGGANYTKAVRTMELCLKTPSKVILVVTFGTIARADVMAQGLVEAIKAHQQAAHSSPASAAPMKRKPLPSCATPDWNP